MLTFAQVDTLTQENMRLAGEVRRRGERERRMMNVKTDVNTELRWVLSSWKNIHHICSSVRQVDVQEHCDKMEELNKKILEINVARSALESEIETLAKTVQGLNSSVKHSLAKERALERRVGLQDQSLRELERDCEKMRSYNLQVNSSLWLVQSDLDTGLWLAERDHVTCIMCHATRQLFVWGCPVLCNVYIKFVWRCPVGWRKSPWVWGRRAPRSLGTRRCCRRYSPLSPRNNKVKTIR